MPGGTTTRRTGLIASKHVEWVHPTYRELTDFDYLLIRELLVGSPALGVSAQSSGFISRFNITDDKSASDFLSEIEKIISIEWLKSAKSLKEYLERENLIDSRNWLNTDFVAMTKPDQFNSNFPKSISDIQQNTSEKPQTKLTKINFIKIDSFFRHIRNALAHGTFTRFEKNGETAYAFQDKNSDGFVSARAVISKPKLSKLIELTGSVDTKITGREEIA